MPHPQFWLGRRVPLWMCGGYQNGIGQPNAIRAPCSPQHPQKNVSLAQISPYLGMNEGSTRGVGISGGLCVQQATGLGVPPDTTGLQTPLAPCPVWLQRPGQGKPLAEDVVSFSLGWDLCVRKPQCPASALSSLGAGQLCLSRSRRGLSGTQRHQQTEAAAAAVEMTGG